MQLVDIVAFGAHPDDIELGAGGMIVQEIKNGNTVGLVDLTKGELGTRGTKEIREAEAAAASEILGATFRHNMGFRDGFFQNDEAHQLEIIKVIRTCKPTIVLLNAPYDRHPDHAKGAELVQAACFLAGLPKIITYDNDGNLQEAFRPRVTYQYIQFYNLVPNFIYDISQVMDTKMESIKAYSSQFYNPTSDEPATVISSQHFLKNVTERASDMGRWVGLDYGEGFIVQRPIAIKNIHQII